MTYLHDEGRPLPGPALKVITADNTTSILEPIRCSRCSARLTAARSISRGLGPVCARAGSTIAASPVGEAVRLERAVGSLTFALTDTVPAVQMQLLTIAEIELIVSALDAATESIDTAADAANLRGGWSA